MNNRRLRIGQKIRALKQQKNMPVMVIIHYPTPGRMEFIARDLIPEYKQKYGNQITIFDLYGYLMNGGISNVIS